MITLILAIDNDNLVGKTDGNYGLAWHYPEDMEFYKKMCINKINVYGRKTLEKINRKLPNREMICLTRNKDYKFLDIKTVTDYKEILNLSKENEIMINGGVEIFKLFFKYADKLIVTRINDSHDGDVYFNDFSTDGFKLVENTKNGKLDFQIWEKI